MSSNDLLMKSAHNEWVRMGTQFTNAIEDLEKEIVRMREKRLPEDLINQKDNVVETLVSFYNCCEQIIASYRVAIATKQMEIHILNDLLSHAMQESWSGRLVERFRADLQKLPGDVNQAQARRALVLNQLSQALNG